MIYTYTYHDSSCALELTVRRFIDGKRRQTAASCKQSHIWDRKALLSAPWPVTALQGISSVFAPPLAVSLHPSCTFGMQHSRHQDTAGVTAGSWRTGGTAEPISRASHRHTGPHSGVQSKQQNHASPHKQPGLWSGTVVCSLLMSIYFLICSLSLALSITFLHVSPNV